LLRLSSLPEFITSDLCYKGLKVLITSPSLLGEGLGRGAYKLRGLYEVESGLSVKSRLSVIAKEPDCRAGGGEYM